MPDSPDAPEAVAALQGANGRLRAENLTRTRSSITSHPARVHAAVFDETTLRAEKAGTKKYVLGAFTGQCTLLFPGARTLASFRDFGILPDFVGTAITDRYVNYWH